MRTILIQQGVAIWQESLVFAMCVYCIYLNVVCVERANFRVVEKYERIGACAVVEKGSLAVSIRNLSRYVIRAHNNDGCSTKKLDIGR